MKHIHWALAALLLSGCSVYSYADADQYSVYTEPLSLDVPASGLKKVTVDWILGEVEIKQGDKIGIVEEKIGENYLPLYYRQKENELAIKVWKSGTTYQGGKPYAKKLILTLPKEIEKMEIDVVSAKYTIDLGTVNCLDIDSVSGDGKVKAESVNELEMDTVSGEISFEAKQLNKGDFDSVSGRVTATCEKAKDLSFSSVSGNVDLTVKDSSDLGRIKMRTTSGDGKFAFDGVRGINLDFDTVSGDKDLAFVDGSDASKAKFDVEFSSTSGDLAITKIQAFN